MPTINILFCFVLLKSVCVCVFVCVCVCLRVCMWCAELLEKKRSCHNHMLAKADDHGAKAAYKTACSTLQAKLRTMQND